MSATPTPRVPAPVSFSFLTHLVSSSFLTCFVAGATVDFLIVLRDVSNNPSQPAPFLSPGTTIPLTSHLHPISIRCGVAPGNIHFDFTDPGTQSTTNLGSVLDVGFYDPDYKSCVDPDSSQPVEQQFIHPSNGIRQAYALPDDVSLELVPHPGGMKHATLARVTWAPRVSGLGVEGQVFGVRGSGKGLGVRPRGGGGVKPACLE